jgi:hypothetical protein
VTNDLPHGKQVETSRIIWVYITALASPLPSSRLGALTSMVTDSWE